MSVWICNSCTRFRVTISFNCSLKLENTNVKLAMVGVHCHTSSDCSPRLKRVFIAFLIFGEWWCATYNSDDNTPMTCALDSLKVWKCLASPKSESLNLWFVNKETLLNIIRGNSCWRCYIGTWSAHELKQRVSHTRSLDDWAKARELYWVTPTHMAFIFFYFRLCGVFVNAVLQKCWWWMMSRNVLGNRTCYLRAADPRTNIKLMNQ